MIQPVPRELNLQQLFFRWLEEVRRNANAAELSGAGGVVVTHAMTGTTVDLPDQSGNSGEFLTTDGATATWTTLTSTMSTNSSSVSGATVTAALNTLLAAGAASGSAGDIQYSGGSGAFSAESDLNYSASTNVLTVNGKVIQTSANKKIVSKTTTYTATTSDHTILCDATGGAFSVTLPTAASAYNSTVGSGQILCIVKTDGGLNAVTIDGSGAELVDGSATQAIAVAFDSWMIQSNGTAWFRIA